MENKEQKIEQAKQILAQQLGADRFENIDRGALPSRVNGDMVRTLMEIAADQMTVADLRRQTPPVTPLPPRHQS